MSTHCVIAVRLSYNCFKAVYCHSDGYVDGTGATLVKNFDTKSKALSLVNLGDLSYVVGAEDRSQVCAYHRDRSEPWSDVLPKVFETRSDMLAAYSSISYFYVFELDHEWHVHDGQGVEYPGVLYQYE